MVYPYQSYWKFGRLGIRHDWLPANHGIDVWSPMGSLFRYLRPTLDSFPAEGTRLVPDPALQEVWRARLAELGDKPKVGVFRRSGLMSTVRRNKYVGWEVWSLVLAHRDVTFLGLHYDDDGDERDYVKEEFGAEIIRFDDLDYREDLENVLALISCLDLVISPASSVQWFATALGVPTIGLAFTRVWTMLGQDYSPMQPSLHPVSNTHGPAMLPRLKMVREMERLLNLPPAENGPKPA
jgi:hypothetical protein